LAQPKPGSDEFGPWWACVLRLGFCLRGQTGISHGTLDELLGRKFTDRTAKGPDCGIPVSDGVIEWNCEFDAAMGVASETGV